MKRTKSSLLGICDSGQASSHPSDVTQCVYRLRSAGKLPAPSLEDDQGSHRKETSGEFTPIPDYPVETCMAAVNPKNPMFVYKFTDNGKLKCYKFVYNKPLSSNMIFLTRCSGCQSSYMKRRRRASYLPTTSIRSFLSNGHRMLSDPYANHLPGCAPMDYDDVLKKFPLLKDEVKDKFIKGEACTCIHSDLPFRRLMKPVLFIPLKRMFIVNTRKPVFMYKFEDENEKVKCCMFGVHKRLCCSMDFLTRCSGCRSMYVNGKRDRSSSVKSDGHRMLSDPHANHLPGCVPMDYDDAIRKCPIVKDEVKEKIIKGENISMYLYPLGSPFVEPHEVDRSLDYSVEMCMSAFNAKNPSFLFKFRDANDNFKCYKFLYKLRTSCMYFTTTCSGCRSIYENRKRSESSLRLRNKKSDGHRMLSDPHANHLPGCVPMDYDDAIRKCPIVKDEVKEKIIKGEDISMHLLPNGSLFRQQPTSLSEFPVSMVMKASDPIHPVFVYRLIDNPDLCYKFIICKYHRSLNGDFSTVCSRCRAIYAKEKQDCPPRRKTDGFAMLSDPVARHLPGCLPFNYKEALKQSPIIKNIVKRKIIDGEDVSIHLPPIGSPFVKVEVSESTDSELDDIFGPSQLVADEAADDKEFPTEQVEDSSGVVAPAPAKQIAIARRGSLLRKAKKRRNPMIYPDVESYGDNEESMDEEDAKDFGGWIDIELSKNLAAGSISIYDRRPFFEQMRQLHMILARS